MDDDVRLLVSVALGLVLGSVLGALFVPDPTSTLALALSTIAAVAIATGIYRSNWRVDG